MTSPVVERFDWAGPRNDHLLAIIERYCVDCVIDVGAHIGEFGLALRARGYNGDILSFEPVPRYAEKLRDAAESDLHWRIFEVGLGGNERLSEMVVVDGTGSSFLQPNGYARRAWPEYEFAVSQRLPVRRLDNVLNDANMDLSERRLLLKTDTQGYDLEVFKGVGRYLSSIVAIQAELSVIPIYDGMPAMQTAVAAYQDAGFQFTGLFPVSVERLTLRVVEFDCIMVQSDRLPTPTAPLYDGFQPARSTTPQGEAQSRFP